MPEVQPVDRHELDQLVRGEHGHPHAVLGPHRHDGGVTIRVFKPLASRVVIRHGETETELAHEYSGIWAGALPVADVPDYRVAVSYNADPMVVRRPVPLPPHPRARPTCT